MLSSRAAAFLLVRSPRWHGGAGMSTRNCRCLAAGQLLGFNTQKLCRSQSKKIFLFVSFLAGLTGRRFGGFGTGRLIPEQAAAIEALALIGGGDAADAVAEMIERAVVQGPGLQIALSAAARLGSRLSSAALRQLLQHAEPVMRVDA